MACRKEIRAKAFCKVIDEFMDDLIQVFPGEIKFTLAQKTYQTMKFISGEQEVIKPFIKYVLPHKSKIDDRDEEFFLSDEFQNSVPEVYGFIFKDIKILWTNGKLSQNTKETIFLYVQKMLKLAKMYNSV